MLRLAWRIWYKNMPAHPEHATTALERLVALAERDAVSEPAVASVASLLASRACRVHIIGIGGTGMSAIAALLLDLGHIVTGSDQAQSSAVDALVERGATVTIGHGGALDAATDIVARSTAITDSNPEVQSATAASIPVVRRAEILAALSRLAPSLAVSGTHGKTTTSAMLATALVHAGVPTSYLIGSTVSALGGAASWHPNASYFVIEADESDRTHLALSRFGGIVTNIEPEHLDRYGSAGAVIDGFIEFVRGCEGPVLLCADDPGCRLVSNFLRRSTDGARTIHTYGSTPGADYVIAEVDLHPSSSSFVLVAGDHSYPVRLNVTGGHNVANAAAVVSLVHALGGDVASTITALERFGGTARRFEYRGEAQGVRFVDDYAHHPTEVQATLAAARQGGTRVVAVFQPHLYSRTSDNAAGFGQALTAADVVVVADVYGAREEPVPGITGEMISRAAVDAGADPARVHYVPARSELAAAVARILQPGDTCLSLGAGDITLLADEVQAILSQSEHADVQ